MAIASVGIAMDCEKQGQSDTMVSKCYRWAYDNGLPEIHSDTTSYDVFNEGSCSRWRKWLYFMQYNQYHCAVIIVHLAVRTFSRSHDRNEPFAIPSTALKLARRLLERENTIFFNRFPQCAPHKGTRPNASQVNQGLSLIPWVNQFYSYQYS